MRKVTILYKDLEAGQLIQHDNGSFTFRYHHEWFIDASKPSISLSLPKNQQTYYAETLFPFFHNMLPEGINKQVVCQLNKIDRDDDFGLLIATAKYDSIGAVKVAPL